MMEDPIRFDLWGSIGKGANSEATKAILEVQKYASELEIRKIVNKSTGERTSVRIAYHLSWSEVQNLIRSSDWLLSWEVFQEGYEPNEKEHLQYCAAHALFYGGISGCHVCSGFYVR